jgi:PDZ domain-containing protein
MPPAPPSSRGRRIATVALICVLVVGIALFAGSKVSTGQYAITPGSAQPVAPLITVAGHPEVSGSGQIMLTDVLLSPVTWTNYLWFKLSSNTSFIPSSALVPPGVSPSQLDTQGYLEMAQSKEAAKTAALERLGYKVDATPDGAVVTAVASDSAASSTVSVADVITGVGAQSVTSSCGFVAAIHDLAPGTKISLQVRPAAIHAGGQITNGAPVERTVVLGPPLSKASTGCPGVVGPQRSSLGVGLEDDVSYHYPIAISISTPDIGGPSAGLAMTLGIIDELSGGSLVHHKILAATGTMAPDGIVGDVGGVPQKTVAVASAGATTFFVPVVEKSAAESKAPSSLAIVPVKSLDQALNELFKLGGSITMANGSIEGKQPASSGS